MYGQCKSCGRIGNHSKDICENCLWSRHSLKIHKKYLKADMEREEKEKEMEEKERRENPVIDPVEPFLSPRCEKCGKNAATLDEHTCPFKSDIHDDNETMCNCCNDCCQECADEI